MLPAMQTAGRALRGVDPGCGLAQDVFGISAPRAGMAVGFLAGGNGDIWQQKLVTPENHIVAV